MKDAMKKRLRADLAAAGLALGLHYLMMILAHIIISGGFSLPGFWAMLVERLTTPGDAPRYLDLAQNGYVAAGENAINLVFYPLYPLLMRGLSLLTGSLSAAGVIISQGSFAGAAVLLRRLILLDGDQRSAWDGVLLFSLYPFSMFAMGVFTEGLFLLLTIGCLYALRRQKFIWAGALGFLAALTRIQGVLLIFPAVYEAVTLRLGAEKRRFRPGDFALLLIPAGFCVYLGINYALHGNCLQFLLYEEAAPWYQTTKWIGENIQSQYALAGQYQGLSIPIYYPQIALFFLALGALAWGLRNKMRISYLLYGGAYLGFTYLSGWMISGGRYMLCCFPVFIALSGLRQGLPRRLLLMGTGMLFFLYSLLYLMGYAIM